MNYVYAALVGAVVSMLVTYGWANKKGYESGNKQRVYMYPESILFLVGHTFVVLFENGGGVSVIEDLDGDRKLYKFAQYVLQEQFRAGDIVTLSVDRKDIPYFVLVERTEVAA